MSGFLRLQGALRHVPRQFAPFSETSVSSVVRYFD